MTLYAYDAEGNLTEKQEGSQVWRYRWGADGMLQEVERPDATHVRFEYDPLGRRIAKHYRGQTTRWVWDGNVPLHEWVEGALTPKPQQEAAVRSSETPAIKKREAELESLLAQGPPARGSEAHPITWLFEPESFSPLAKLIGGQHYSIIGDHLGAPIAMTSASGERVWSAAYSIYGELNALEGARGACPFRWPGQYEDLETGLYYNRFRYYDAESGQYASQDPIGLAGGPGLYSYATDPLGWVDPLGLAHGQGCGSRVPHRSKPRIDDGNLREGWEHIDARHVSGTHPDGPGDLFAPGTTRTQIQKAAEDVVGKGTRISNPDRRIQTFEKRTKVNGRRDRVRVVVDSDDNNRVITTFPVRSE